MKAFVTGSTGLLGSNLVRLLLDQGYEVKALARSISKAEKMLGAHDRLRVIVGDMEQIDGFAGELAGCDVLFHTAAYFREYYLPGEHWETLQRINVDSTLRLLDEAQRHGLKKAIYVSSSTVIGQRADGVASDETTGPDAFTQQNLYAKSKVLAEQRIAEWLKTHSLPVVLILPSAMIGPGDAAPTNLGQSIIATLNRQMPAIPPGSAEFVDVRDTAQAMINAVERGKSGERYLLNESHHPIAEMMEIACKAAGVPLPRLRATYPMTLATAWFMERMAKITGGTPQVTMETVRITNRKRVLSGAKAVRELGITYRPFADSLRDEVAWFIQNGYVKSPAKPSAALAQQHRGTV
ncbi:MAG: NAD-dependent epimerase/dehydratase family protein [Anaerolineae bacterium]